MLSLVLTIEVSLMTGMGDAWPMEREVLFSETLDDVKEEVKEEVKEVQE